MMNWMILAAILEWVVLATLLVSSIWSIAIMIDRRRYLGSRAKDAALEQAKQLITAGNRKAIDDWLLKDHSLVAGTLKMAVQTQDRTGAIKLSSSVQPGGGPQNDDSVDRAVRSYLTEQKMQLEKGLPVLATLGANAPFIGLFGTVLGIIRAFAALADSSGGATSVMTGISQSLYATAAGLFVAIPAVIAFNHFSNQLRVRIQACDSIKDFYLANRSLIERQG